MDILLTYYSGEYVQFNNCTFEGNNGLLRIKENGYIFQYDFDNIKEFILVNEYNLSYAIEHGYRNIA